MRYILILLFTILYNSVFSQNVLKGKVVDKYGTAVFAASVYLKESPSIGTATDFAGNFTLNVNTGNDSLVISFMGYKTKSIPVKELTGKLLEIAIEEDHQMLQEVNVAAQDPISEKFSVIKLDKLDIYLNPVSSGDPLKAITSLPSSTNTDETANPSLRGSSAERTRVALNNVPIYNPVRNSQINGIGNFSLFNTEIIHKQYVYASNPPLTYGNTSAGLIEIETIKELAGNQLQVSASAANAGLFLSQKIHKTSFLQLFGNYQFSNIFIGLNKKSLPFLNSFRSKDTGLNFHKTIGKKISFNSFNYFIDESYDVTQELYTYKGDALAGNRRLFTVNNIKYTAERSILSINSGANFSNTKYNFGSLNSNKEITELYTSVDLKWFALSNIILQTGISNDYGKNKFKDTVPLRFYDLSPEALRFYSKEEVRKNSMETYVYTNWRINERWMLSSGVRSNLPTREQQHFLSSQLGLKHDFAKCQSILLSGGKYHNYSTPNFYSKDYSLLSSYQIAIDYSYYSKNTLINAAAFYKMENGENMSAEFLPADNNKFVGLEFFVERHFKKYFKFSLANTFLNQTIEVETKKFRGDKDLNYFVKATLSYNNLKLVTVAVTYLARPGLTYTPIISSQNNMPAYSSDINSTRYKNYNNISVSLSRYFQMNKTAVIAFLSINNILNTKNENSLLYNTDYSLKGFNYYQLRTVYFGFVWQLNY